jgi:hypothetical protein
MTNAQLCLPTSFPRRLLRYGRALIPVALVWFEP